MCLSYNCPFGIGGARNGGSCPHDNRDQMLLALLFFAVDLGSSSAPYHTTGSFAFDGDTRSGAPFFDSYACAADKAEAGPEVIFELVLGEESDVDLIVEVPSSAVDVDVHLLGSLARTGTQATDCLARADVNLTEFHLAAGTYYVVADSFGASAAKAGPFRLFARAYPTQALSWSTIARGVRWGRGSYEEASGFSVLNVVDVDTTAGARIDLVDNGACKKLGDVALPARAVAATNAGFFTSTCGPDGLLRVDGSTIATAKGSQHAIGLLTDGGAIYAKPVAGSSFTDAPSAVGGFGYFDLTGGAPVIDHDGTTFGNVRHPRTVIFSAPSRLGLFTVEGRSDAGLGARFSELAAIAVEQGAANALNLDGGGSTVMWVKDEPMKGIVNYPSDSTSVVHGGVRSVRSLAVVFADPVARPFFVTLADHRPLEDGDELHYAARAVAPGFATVVYRLVGAVPNAVWTGSELRFTPDGSQNGVQTLILEACAGTGPTEGCATQSISVPVQMTPPPPGPSGATGTTASTGATGATGESGGNTPGTATGGTGNTSGNTPGTPSETPPVPETRGCGGCQGAAVDPAMPIALLLLLFIRGRSTRRTA